MLRICLFGGTTEGRKLAEFLEQQDVWLTVCVATEYGGELLGTAENLNVSEKRLTREEIQQLLTDERFDLVIDATHPYAQQVTENISAACTVTATPYKRLLRSESAFPEGSMIVPNISEAIGFLSKTTGNILLTTGSKEIAKFAVLPNFTERVYARVLPISSSLQACTDAGLQPSHILAMQGPFSREMNEAMLKTISAQWLVTKDGGAAGGFEEKAAAAMATGCGLVIIGRPPQQQGLNEKEMYDFLGENYGFRQAAEITIAGIGPGAQQAITPEVKQAIETADCLIGASRMLEAAPSAGKIKIEAIAPDAIVKAIQVHPECRSFAVLMSGDSGFFSGTKKLLPLLSGYKVKVLPGISSLSYLCAKLGVSYENVWNVSLHGRDHNFISDIRSHSRVFILTGGENTPDFLCQKLTEQGLGNVKVSIGERLSYPDERITVGNAEEFAKNNYAQLSAVLIENNAPDAVITQGLPDDLFIRDTGEKGLIPMTKSEIRAVCLSKLRLTENAVCWDIGAGSGSVAIEMALQAKQGKVYAIEQDEAAAVLISKNAKQLSAENISIIHGKAPEVCSDLETPTHVFIGGANGNIRQILILLLERKSDIRITATAVTLDTITELYALLDTIPFSETEILMLQTAKAKKAGAHHLMTGGNPVYIFTMRISGANL